MHERNKFNFLHKLAHKNINDRDQEPLMIQKEIRKILGNDYRLRRGKKILKQIQSKNMRIMANLKSKLNQIQQPRPE